MYSNTVRGSRLLSFSWCLKGHQVQNEHYFFPKSRAMKLFDRKQTFSRVVRVCDRCIYILLARISHDTPSADPNNLSSPCVVWRTMWWLVKPKEKKKLSDLDMRLLIFWWGVELIIRKFHYNVCAADFHLYNSAASRWFKSIGLQGTKSFVELQSCLPLVQSLFKQIVGRTSLFSILDALSSSLYRKCWAL